MLITFRGVNWWKVIHGAAFLCFLHLAVCLLKNLRCRPVVMLDVSEHPCYRAVHNVKTICIEARYGEQSTGLESALPSEAAEPAVSLTSGFCMS